MKLRPLSLSFPFLLGGVLDIDRDLGGGLARVERPNLDRDMGRDLDLDLDGDLDRLERPVLERDLDRPERLNLEREIDRGGDRDLDRDLDLDNEALWPRLGDLE